MRATKRFGMAAAVVLTLIVGFAAPASANAPVEVIGGRLTTVLENFDLTPGSQGTPPCPDKPSTINFTTTAGGTWTLAGGFSGQFQLPAGSGNWYQADFTVLATIGGTWGAPTGPGTNPLAGQIVIQVDIFRPVNCVKGTRICRVTSVITLNAPQNPAQPPSTYKSAGAGGVGPGLPTTVSGDLGTISGTGMAVVQAPCAPPFNLLNNTPVQLKDLQAEVL